VYKSSYLETLGDRSDRDYFKNAILGKANFSNVIISRSTNRPIVVYAQPILKNGAVTGVIGASIDLEFLSQLVNVELEESIHSKSYGYIVDELGKVIGHPDASYVSTMKDLSMLEPVRRALNGETGTGEYQLDGSDKMVSYSHIHKASWSVFVQIPKNEAFQSVWMVQKFMTYTFHVILALSVFAAYGLAWYLKKPIAQTVRLIENFEVSREVLKVCSVRDDEFAIINNAFIKMAETVVQNQKELEARVSERTGELKQAVDDLIETQIELETTNENLQVTIEELRIAQEKIIQSEKMTALGRMSTNFAHEINTPLGNAIMLVDLSEHSAQHLIKDIEEGVVGKRHFIEKMTELIDMHCYVKQQLVNINALFESFSRSNLHEMNANNTSEIKLSSFLNIHRLDLDVLLENPRHKLVMNNHLDKDISISYPEKLLQILKILVKNSVEHGFSNDSDGEILIEMTTKSNILYVYFLNNGKSISEKNLPHIFEPYFKENMATEGIGIGLTVVYTLVVHFFNGKISCSNLDPNGIKFVIEIPIKSI
jgi:methyl-accepting chemotaxis protein